jgi:hypothetical protein
MSMIGRMGGAAALAVALREAVAREAVREVLVLSLADPQAGGNRLRRRLLADALAPLRESRRVRLFDLPGGDLVALATPPAPEMATAADALAALAEDPAAVRRLALPGDAAAVLAAIERALGCAGSLPTGVRPGAPPLDAAGVASLARALTQADLSPFQRCQMVCRIAPDTAPEPLFEDRRVPAASLVAALTGQDMAADPALARQAQRALDRRVIAALARAETVAEARPAAVPLLPESLLGDGFPRLEAAWPRRARRVVTLVLPAGAMLADPGLGAAALDVARGGGWRLALDSAGPAELRALPAAALGIGLLRVPFSAALVADPAALAAACGAEIWLAGADRAAAIAWGWENGVRLFQGRLVEKRRG